MIKSQNSYNIIIRILGIWGAIISAILVINFSNLVVLLTDFGERYLSQDNNIGLKTVFMIKIFIVISLIFIIVLSITFILNLSRKVSLFITAFFQVNNPLSNNICSIKRFDLYVLVIGTLLGVLQIYYLLTFGETSDKFAKPLTLPEGALEKFYALLLLFSIIILLFSIIKINRKLFASKMRKKVIFLILLISGILLLILGEEISWGQQIFGWDSFGIFSEYNYQNETNIHNFFNPLMKYIYPTVGFGSFLVLVFIWFFPQKRGNYFFNLFFPHPSLFFLVFIMTSSSFLGGGGETFEQLFVIFVLLYSFRIFMCLRFPSIDLLSQET